MPSHKERTGKTRFGMFLKKVAKQLPELAEDVIEIAFSSTPLGNVLSKVKEKLAGTATGAIGDQLLKELNDIPEEDMKLFEMELADKSDARNMYKSTDHEQADKIADSIMKRNLPYILVMSMVNIAVIIFYEKLSLTPALILAIGNILGMVIQSLIQERSQVVSFYMGSSLGSKLKDKAKNMFNNSK